MLYKHDVSIIIGLMFKIIKFLFLFLFLTFMGYWFIIEFPSFLFSHKHQNSNLVIYSDKPIPSNITEISNEVLARLKKSRIFRINKTYEVYISNDRWRWMLLSYPANLTTRLGGFNAGFHGNAFIRPSVISENKIIPPGSYLLDAEQRDLVYFITHEVVHALLYDEVGYISNFINYPRWLQDGYPDYIAKNSFDFKNNLLQFKRKKQRLTVQSGLYVRYHLYVAYLMDIKGYTIKEIIKNIPDESDIVHSLESLSL